MSATNFTTADAAAGALVNAAARQGVTPSSQLAAHQLPLSVLANMLAGEMGGAELSTGPGAGITAGTGTIVKTSITKAGGVITTEIVVDLTGLAAAAAGDVIGAAAGGAAYICRIPAESGTIMGGTLRCFEAPAGGDADIDVHTSTAATGAYNDAVSGLAGNTQAVNSGTLALTTDASVIPDTIVAGDYLYLVSVGATAAAYTAGRICLTLKGV
jgi:hypothetical protein